MASRTVASISWSAFATDTVFVRIASIAAGATIPITFPDINTGITTDHLTTSALARAVHAFTKNGAVMITGSKVEGIDHQIRTVSVATGHSDPTTRRIAGMLPVLVMPDRTPGNGQRDDEQADDQACGFHSLRQKMSFPIGIR
jgi:hypothetical protein